MFASAAAGARAFGCSRDTFLRYARELGITDVRRDGARVYELTPELVARLAVFASAPEDVDPSKLPARAARDFWLAAEARLRVRQRAGELCERTDVEQHVGRLTTIVLRCFETIPDVLERDCGLTPHAVTVVERELDAARVQLHAELTRGEEEA